jgi:hypothetical protein
MRLSNSNGADAPDGPCDGEAWARGSFGALGAKLRSRNFR